jgi:hypothetical protein
MYVRIMNVAFLHVSLNDMTETMIIVQQEMKTISDEMIIMGMIVLITRDQTTGETIMISGNPGIIMTIMDKTTGQTITGSADQ